MASLNDPFQKRPITAQTKQEIIQEIWNPKAASRIQQGEVQCDSYFTYYSNQCHDAMCDRGRHLTVRKHSELLDIAEQLRSHKVKKDVQQYLLSKQRGPTPFNQNEQVNNSIDLTARLLVMMDIGTLPYSFSGRKQVVWEEGSLKDFVHKYLNTPPVLGHDKIKLEKLFNGRNLSRIAGIEIEWTDNLADHLRVIDDDNKRVAIFQHASFLKCQDR
jgi:hypothetical protein